MIILKSLIIKALILKIGFKEKLKLKIHKPVIGILGVTYKEDSLSIKNSPSINFLNKNKNEFFIHYFQAKKIQIERNFSSKFRNFNFVLKNSNIIIVLHSHKTYSNFNLNRFKNIKVILDPFKYFKKKGSSEEIKHISL